MNDASPQDSGWSSYSRLVWGNLLNNHALERALSATLARRFGPSIRDCRMLDVGCGYGGHLISMQRFGVEPENLFGIDMDEDRVESARRRYPLLNLTVGDARRLPYPDGHFDIVTQNVCFSSILDEEVRRDVAREMMRTLKPGGLIIWYDFRYDNPRNSRVRGVDDRRLRSYVPGMRAQVRSIILFPWLARGMASPAWTPLFHLAYAVRPLRTHLFAVLSKDAAHEPPVPQRAPVSERKRYFLFSLVWLAVLAGALAAQVWWLAALAVAGWIPFFDRSRKPFLPVMMFHSINDRYSHFLFSNICVTRRYFKLAMGWLRWRGYRTLTSEEAEAFVHDGRDFGRRVVHLTFDDGYLDNWVNVLPILKRNGQRGTVYVSLDFIRREGEPRPVRERGDEAVEDWGFMNLAEIRAAHQSGVLEFYPHGRTHTWYECEDRLLGFHRPGDRMAWLDWNRRPAAKADWIRDFPQGFVPEGWPVLEHGKSLGTRRFLLDEELLQGFVDSLADLPRPWIPEALEARWTAFRAEHPVIGRLETDEEWEARRLDELESTRDFLERELGPRRHHFCWPGGGKDADSLRLAYENAGYRMSTIHQDETPNRRGVPSRWLYRVGAGSSQNIQSTWYNVLRFVAYVETYRRNYCWVWLFALTEFIEKLVARRRGNRRPDDNRTPFLGYPLQRG